MLNDPNHPKASVFIDPKNMTHAYKKKNRSSDYLGGALPIYKKQRKA